MVKRKKGRSTWIKPSTKRRCTHGPHPRADTARLPLPLGTPRSILQRQLFFGVLTALEASHSLDTSKSMSVEYKIQIYFVAIFYYCCLEVYRNYLVTVGMARCARTKYIQNYLLVFHNFTALEIVLLQRASPSPARYQVCKSTPGIVLLLQNFTSAVMPWQC